DALGHEATGPDLIAGDQLVEAHDLATPAIAVVAGGLADASRLPALRPFSRTLQSPIPCGGRVMTRHRPTSTLEPPATDEARRPSWHSSFASRHGSQIRRARARLDERTRLSACPLCPSRPCRVPRSVSAAPP